MTTPNSEADIVQTSITMERRLKRRYSKLACSLDLNFSQLVRYALLQVAEENIKKTGEVKTPPAPQ